MRLLTSTLITGTRTFCRALGLLVVLGSTAVLGLWATSPVPSQPAINRAVPPSGLVQTVNQQLTTLSLPFIRNQGQTDERVQFYAQTFGGTVFVTTAGELVYALSQREEDQPAKGVVLTETLIGGTVREVSGEGETPTRVSSFHGNDPSKWQRNLPTYARVSLGEVYAGIELELTAQGKQVEKRFHIRPGADPAQIRLTLRGGRALRVNTQGELEVETELGVVSVSKPLAYQEASGKKEL